MKSLPTKPTPPPTNKVQLQKAQQWQNCKISSLNSSKIHFPTALLRKYPWFSWFSSWVSPVRRDLRFSQSAEGVERHRGARGPGHPMERPAKEPTGGQGRGDFGGKIWCKECFFGTKRVLIGFLKPSFWGETRIWNSLGCFSWRSSIFWKTNGLNRMGCWCFLAFRY